MCMHALMDVYSIDEDLLVVLRDLFIGTSETVGSALEFAILHLALQPDIQRRVYEEINYTIGTDEQPSYTDREQ